MAHSFTGLYKALGKYPRVRVKKKKTHTQRQTRSDCTVRKESVIQLKNIEYRTGRERLREAWKVGRSRKEERQLMQEL